jgi:hypothetical protein
MGYPMMKLVINKIYWDLQRSYEENCATYKAVCLATLRRFSFGPSNARITTPNIVRIIERFIYTHES